MPYKVTGRIIETESGWGVPNLTVEVWDEDQRTADDRLGSTITLPDGSFAILFREGDFQEGFFDQKPDLYIRVLKPDGTLLHSSQEQVRADAGRQESFIVQIPREKLGEMAPREEALSEEIARGVDLLSLEEEEFVEHAIGEERKARKRTLYLSTGVGLVLVAFLFWFGFWNNESRVVSRMAQKWGASVVLIQTDETGSGVIFDKEGHILTNYHVVDGGPPYNVRLKSGRTLSAELVGFDPYTDLAVLQVSDITPQELVVPSPGDPTRLQQGDLAIAIGNPLGLEGTVTIGHVSFLNRSLETADPFGAVIDGVIQTDAAINPGNSGGGLFNGKGELVGINTQILTVRGGGNVGLGFAIPINLAEKIARALIAQGYVSRPFLGVRTSPSGSQGVRVELVAGRTAAEEAGLQSGDVITQIDDTAIRLPADIQRVIDQHEIGDTVEVTVVRDGQAQVVPVVLKPRPKPGHAVRIVQVAPQTESDEAWVELENQDYRTVNLAGYLLRIGQEIESPLPDVALSPLRRVRVFIGTGETTEEAIYLNVAAPVSLAQASVMLLDPAGNLIDELSQ